MNATRSQFNYVLSGIDEARDGLTEAMTYLENGSKANNADSDEHVGRLLKGLYFELGWTYHQMDSHLKALESDWVQFSDRFREFCTVRKTDVLGFEHNPFATDTEVAFTIIGSARRWHVNRETAVQVARAIGAPDPMPPQPAPVSVPTQSPDADPTAATVNLPKSPADTVDTVDTVDSVDSGEAAFEREQAQLLNLGWRQHMGWVD